MSYVVMFFAGAFLCNSIPHLASGLRGEPFPTPFARPRGVGLSSPFVNFLWGSFNVVVGIILVSGRPVVVVLDPTSSLLLRARSRSALTYRCISERSGRKRN
jgi:hypothetical protein